MKQLIIKHQITTFILLSYAFSWLCWIPVLSQIKADLYSSAPHVFGLLLLGGYSPTISAIILSRIIGGKQFVEDLLSKYKILKVGYKWYAVALLATPLLIFIATMIFVSQGGALGWINYMVFPFFPVFLIVASVFGPLGEELGWRGFLLPRISDKYGFFTTSLLIGIIWTFWDSPLF
jgi:membrane protease YdiL (CAAX protease family)